MIFDRQQLEAFAAVVEMRHFGEAAAALNITRGAVSLRIKALEETVGSPLVVRDGNTPTPAGEVLLRHIRILKILEADTQRQIKPLDGMRPRVAIAVNADSLATWFEAAAWEIAERNVALELIVDDQDHTLPLLAKGEAIGCVSTSSDPPTGFLAEPIGMMEYECVANVEFAERYFPQGLGLHGVLAAPAVLYNRKDGLHSQFLERFLDVEVRSYAAHYFPSPAALLAAIENGIGYGLVPCLQAKPLIDAGGLIRLAPSHKVEVNLYWHHWKTAPSNAQAISELVVSHARRSLLHSGDHAVSHIGDNES
ncbi:chromosome replication initiation inhibitor protein [Burkholderia multivorans]|uniref:HTH-type transcriptional regulator ArgP n=1 Tax=Burkholderia multivorans TaxID=87883 RepID=UPI0019872F04|nr:HTH-type transcriptional regulator ArgP [Burkholderia multivorans]MBU9669212.1 HTH-type transcriptional regulator ArgP [Burkholderia multivorans]CAB5280810.1 chromosome replication initiation inhibitor protein [Burkholderia multivorans]CAB5301271.1 chromosome replication initiation inhibitor protein [Burkholderia multivorans]CAB5302916.1 chromosome replication initiation inhibitor protein [Burkholderia multivorans]CAB5305294.1 chromosome replication initiation inhibitor protein [Burkholderi